MTEHPYFPMGDPLADMVSLILEATEPYPEDMGHNWRGSVPRFILSRIKMANRQDIHYEVLDQLQQEVLDQLQQEVFELPAGRLLSPWVSVHQIYEAVCNKRLGQPGQEEDYLLHLTLGHPLEQAVADGLEFGQPYVYDGSDAWQTWEHFQVRIAHLNDDIFEIKDTAFTPPIIVCLDRDDVKDTAFDVAAWYNQWRLDQVS